MIRAAIAETRVFESWLDYQEALKRAIAPLQEHQLQQRPLAGLRTPAEIAEHIVFGRALHLQRTLGDAAAELAPFLAWDEVDTPPHSAAEIVDGLERTWHVIVATLQCGEAGDALSEDDALVMQTIWGLLDHDLPHAGELSLLLGALGLPGVEI